MRVALASIHPRPLSGQIEGLIGLAQALQHQGHAVDVVSPFPSQALLSSNRLALAQQRHRIFVDQPMRMTRVLSHLVQLASSVDLIQLNLPTPAFALFGDLLQSLVRVPVIIGYETQLVNVRDLLRFGRLFQSPVFYLPRLLINNSLVARLSLHRAAAYIVNSEYQKAELSAVGIAASQIHILPTILPQDKLTRSPHSLLRATLPPGRILTYVGHYNHVKGVDVLVRAFRAIAPRLPNLTLVLSWSGIGESRQVQEMLNDHTLRQRVIQLGLVDVPDLLCASDLVALPYRLTIGQAAFPTTLVEAIAANVPVITTDLPILRELTGGGRTAFLVRPDDPAALAAQIEYVLGDPTCTLSMLQAQREWITLIQPQRVILEYEQLYEQVVATYQTTVLRTGPGRERVR